MLLYLGKNPYSLFRKKKLLQQIQKKQPTIQTFSANYAYFVLAKDFLDEDHLKLMAILDPVCSQWQGVKEGQSVWVTPRFGTISSWSSKATDILHVCGLKKISRIERGILYHFEDAQISQQEIYPLLPLLHDQMTESCTFDYSSLETLFLSQDPTPSKTVDILANGLDQLRKANKELGLALTENEIMYLAKSYQTQGRNPTDTELMMFAQINSEHCRHKIFNAQWTFNGAVEDHTLFEMIKNTYQCAPDGVLSAYVDNGAILLGPTSTQLFVNPITKYYNRYNEPGHMIIKVETHNHPTAISPFAGAATGAGGEIRDEGATGIGGKPKAALTGFSVSNLHIPLLNQPWERPIGHPLHIASSLEIMLQGPIGSASFNNEFGRPNILGYFRTFEMIEENTSSERKINVRGYHKPIMLAGGIGQIRPTAIEKKLLPIGAKLIVLGGPAMLIGLGGGAASSLYSGSSLEHLDFASVQRSNPEIQRRCQEVINACWALGDKNPIISIHDVGAGGLSNAFPELIHYAGQGGLFELRAIPTSDLSLSAMQIWCNEAQERYVLAIQEGDISQFEAIAKRERCPFAVVGQVNDSEQLVLHDKKFNENPVDLPLAVLFGEASKMQRQAQHHLGANYPELTTSFALKELIQRVLQLPTVANKGFLITIGDRTVTGLVARDQMVGPWQVPVADVGVTANGFFDYGGEAMAIGERAPLALLNAKASARMAVGEAITNILAADIKHLSDIKLSANWMAAINYGVEDCHLFEAVKAVGMELCPALSICIPVGKDSLSMQMKWQENEIDYNVAAPLSLIISAFASVKDVRNTLTPQLKKVMDSELMLIDLGANKNRLGGSALAQVIGQLGSTSPDLDDVEQFKAFFKAIKLMREGNTLLAYHDRSDGGLLTTICEMSFAGHLGVSLELEPLGEDYLKSLFNEELGAVIQYSLQDKEIIQSILKEQGLLSCAHIIGTLNDNDRIIISLRGHTLFEDSRVFLQRAWSLTSYHMQALRDNPDCARQEYDSLLNRDDPGLHSSLSFDIPRSFPAILTTKPKVAILREQGVNGQLEMAAAFERVGFDAMDVHMTDIINGFIDLTQFQGLVACGGFSYGDVLGAGRGWANSILFNSKALDQFTAFFNLPTVFVLGVCNGCQMLSHLTEIIPGADKWPRFLTNTSEQFEARLSLVKINQSPSIFFQGMAGSIVPIVTSHGEGRANFREQDHLISVTQGNQVPLQYVDCFDQIAENYPANPNGSPSGIAALTNQDGRFTIIMPHPERCFRTVQFSWHPEDWKHEYSPWIKIFYNSYQWLRSC